MTQIAIKNLPGLQISTLENDNAKLQRLGTLNDSYRKRYATYTKIAAMVVLFLVGFIVIQIVEPMLPAFIGNLLMLVLILFVGYYILGYFGELNSRSALNYDELNVPTKNPGENDDPVNLGDTTKNGDLVPNFETCEDSSCCGTGTYYSSSSHKCLPGPAPAETFDTLDNSSFSTSGEQYVDRTRMSLPMSAVGIAETGIIPSNEGIDKYSTV